jgi:hypothetical protein
MCMIALYDTHSPLAMVRVREPFPRTYCPSARSVRPGMGSASSRLANESAVGLMENELVDGAVGAAAKLHADPLQLDKGEVSPSWTMALARPGTFHSAIDSAAKASSSGVGAAIVVSFIWLTAPVFAAGRFSKTLASRSGTVRGASRGGSPILLIDDLSGRSSERADSRSSQTTNRFSPGSRPSLSSSET